MKSKLKGSRPTDPVKELPLVRQRHYADGWALRDELNAAINAAPRTRDRRHRDDDPVVLPRWAADAACNLVTRSLVENKRGMRNYREDMIHWHRYATCRQLLNAGSKWTDGAVFAEAQEALKGTSFAAGKDGMKKSFETVGRALKRGDHQRFYRSTSYRLYDFLLNATDTTVISVK